MEANRGQGATATSTRKSPARLPQGRDGLPGAGYEAVAERLDDVIQMLWSSAITTSSQSCAGLAGRSPPKSVAPGKTSCPSGRGGAGASEFEQRGNDQRAGGGQRR